MGGIGAPRGEPQCQFVVPRNTPPIMYSPISNCVDSLPVHHTPMMLKKRAPQCEDKNTHISTKEMKSMRHFPVTLKKRAHNDDQIKRTMKRRILKELFRPSFAVQKEPGVVKVKADCIEIPSGQSSMDELPESVALPVPPCIEGYRCVFKTRSHCQTPLRSVDRMWLQREYEEAEERVMGCFREAEMEWFKRCCGLVGNVTVSSVTSSLKSAFPGAVLSGSVADKAIASILGNFGVSGLTTRGVQTLTHVLLWALAVSTTDDPFNAQIISASVLSSADDQVLAAFAGGHVFYQFVQLLQRKKTTSVYEAESLKSVVSTFVEGMSKIVGSCSSYVFDSVAVSTLSNTVMKVLKSATQLNAVRLVLVSMVAVRDWVYEKIVGVPYYFRNAKTFAKEVSNFMSRAERFLALTKVDVPLTLIPRAIDVGSGLREEGACLQRMVVHGRRADSVYAGKIMSIQAKIINSLVRMQMRKNVEELPVEGIWFHISGPPGCGKSTFMNCLPYILMKAVHGVTIQESDIYSYDMSDKYVAGYANHPVVLIDELTAAKFDNPEFDMALRLLGYVSPGRVETRQAGVEEKHNATFTASLILTAGNATDLESAYLTCPEAIKRRKINVFLKVRRELLPRDPGNNITSYLHPDGADKAAMKINWPDGGISLDNILLGFGDAFETATYYPASEAVARMVEMARKHRVDKMAVRDSIVSMHSVFHEGVTDSTPRIAREFHGIFEAIGGVPPDPHPIRRGLTYESLGSCLDPNSLLANPPDVMQVADALQNEIAEAQADDEIVEVTDTMFWGESSKAAVVEKLRLHTAGELTSDMCRSMLQLPDEWFFTNDDEEPSETRARVLVELKKQYTTNAGFSRRTIRTLCQIVMGPLLVEHGVVRHNKMKTLVKGLAVVGLLSAAGCGLWYTYSNYVRDSDVSNHTIDWSAPFEAESVYNLAALVKQRIFRRTQREAPPLQYAPEVIKEAQATVIGNQESNFDVADRINRSMVVFSHSYGSVYGLCLQGQVFLVPDHFFARLKDGDTYEMMWNRSKAGEQVVKVVMDSSSVVRDMDSDIALVKIVTQPGPSVLKHFVREADISRLGDEEAILVTRVSEVARTPLYEIVKYKSVSDVTKPLFMSGKRVSTIPYQISGTDWKTVITDRGWVYASAVPRVVCGSMLVSMNKNIEGTVLGYHATAGNGFKIGVMVTRERLTAMLDRLQSRFPQSMIEPSDTIQPVREAEMDDCTHVSVGAISLVPTLKPSVPQRKSRLVRAPLYGEVFEVKSTQSRLSARNEKGEYDSPLLKQLEKWIKPRGYVDPLVLRDARSHLAARYSVAPRGKEYTCAPLEASEVLNGRRGDEYIHRMNMSASAGGDLRCPKSEIFDYNEDMDWYSLTVDQECEIAQLEYDLRRGVMPKFVLIASLKDEILSFEDALRKTRVFFTPPWQFNFLIKKWFGEACAFMKANHCWISSCVGLNPEGGMWDHMANVLLDRSVDQLFAGDFSGFDRTLLPEFMEAAFSVWIDMISFKRTHAGCPPDEGELNIYWGLALAVCYPIMLFLGGELWMNGGLGSGVDVTSLLGSDSQYLAFLCAFRDANPGMDEEEWRELFNALVIFTYGDDNVGSVPSDFKVDMKGVSEAFASYGMKLTSAANKNEPVSFMAIDSMHFSFLKRRFRKDTDTAYYMCPLSFDSLAQSVHFKLASTSNVEYFESVARDLSFNLMLHGREVFDVYSEKLQKAFNEHGYAITGLDYDVLHSRWIKNKTKSPSMLNMGDVTVGSLENGKQVDGVMREAEMDQSSGGTASATADGVHIQSSDSVKFIEAVPPTITMADVGQTSSAELDRTAAMGHEKMVDVARYLKAALCVKANILFSTASTGILSTIALPDALIAHPPILDKLNNLVFVAGDMRVSVRVNATPQHSGRLLVVWVPQGQHFPTTQYINPTGLSCYPNATLDLSTASSVSLDIPYVSPQTHMEITRGSTADHLGEVHVYVLNQLKVLGTSSPSVTVSVYAQFLDGLDLQAKTDDTVSVNYTPAGSYVRTYQEQRNCMRAGRMREAQMETQAPVTVNVATNPVDSGGVDEHEGVLDNVVSGLAQAGGAAASGLITAGAKTIGSLAKPFLSIFGGTKPATPMILQRTALHPWGVLAHGCGHDSSVILSIDAANFNPEKPQLFGCPEGEDPMSLRRLCCNIGVMFRTVTWSTAGAVGDVITKFTVHPNMCHKVAGDPHIFRLGPINMVASAFRYWTGGLEYKLQISASRFHSGRIAVTYIPRGGNEVPDINTWPAITNTIIFDLKGGNEFVWRVNYRAPTPWLMVLPPGHDTHVTTGDTGVIVVWVVSRLVVQNSTSSTVDVNFWMKGAEDLAFSGATLQNLSYDTSTGGLVPAPPAANVVNGKMREAQMDPLVSKTKVPESRDPRPDVAIPINPGARTDATLPFELANGEVFNMAASLKPLLTRYCGYQWFDRRRVTFKATGGDFGQLAYAEFPIASWVMNPAPEYIGAGDFRWDFVSWFASCYKFHRGSMRLKFVPVFTDVNTSELGKRGIFYVGLSHDNGAPSSSWYVGTSTGAASGSTDASAELSATLTNGAIVQDPNHSPSMEIQVPYYSIRNMHVIRDPTNPGFDAIEDGRPRVRVIYVVPHHGDGGTDYTMDTPIVHVLRSAGDDFQFGFATGIVEMQMSAAGYTTWLTNATSSY
ncbi:hypothetical protein [Beihai picorna-like virus 125]|uniref:hypothetical protein n=1 Tax=Beihai picorna-like virus 125 TaxID=1922554 RepID=UPI00090BE8CF|nr:hypothetical protein [Beihai picorna-like virus 125]APG78928.1 hypothetical protein [Beihai picorna-like virus 125]